MENTWIREIKLKADLMFLDFKNNVSISYDYYNDDLKLELANDLVRNSSGLFVSGCNGDENDDDLSNK